VKKNGKHETGMGWLRAAKRDNLIAAAYAGQTMYDAGPTLAELMAKSLFEHIKHGDDKHQQWLQEQSLVWARSWCDRPKPKLDPRAAWPFPEEKTKDQKPV
jgi:hypothetical protein